MTSPWRKAEISGSFLSRRRVNVDALNIPPSILFDVVETLGYHQGDRACSGADVKDMAILLENLSRRAQKHAVSVHLHGRALVAHVEAFEMEYTHFRIYPLSLLLIHEQSIPHEERPVTHPREIRVMGHDDNCLPVALPEVKEQLMDFRLCLCVQIA